LAAVSTFDQRSKRLGSRS
jgi:mono/diheme cytochrome c family protein